MNPHEKVPDKVCITIKLADLKKCKRLKTQELLVTFNETFGFSADALSSGNYNGTIFWFPLRDTASDLSDTVYDKNKVLDLFKSFQTEAVEALLFLKSLCGVGLQCRGSETEYDLPQGQDFFSVELQDASSIIKAENTCFLEAIKSTRGNTLSTDITSVTLPTFATSLRTINSLSSEQNKSSWLVVNMYKGENMSTKLATLVRDKDLAYSPYVGAATTLTSDSKKPLKGHVFCFQPLPQEMKSLTGFPVHVNGFFALSQNRRHLKWASADQENFHMHRDKSIEWNECLVNEVIPEVYMRLIHELIEMSTNSSSNSDAAEVLYYHKPDTEVAADIVYSCMPDVSLVDSKWEECVKNLYKRLFNSNCVFSRSHARWVHPEEALYTIFDQQNVSADIMECVKNVLNMFENEKTAIVPDHVWKALRETTLPRDISPTVLSQILKSSDIYKHSTTLNERLQMLDYMTKDNDVGLLQDLELLPLENGEFGTFQKRGITTSPVYMCTKEEVELFPGIENKFISTSIPACLLGTMQHIAKSGKYKYACLYL